MNFNWVDYVFFVSLATGAVVGLFKGLSRVLGNLLAVVFAAGVARAFYESFAKTLSSLLGSFSFAQSAVSADPSGGLRLAAMLILLVGAIFAFRLFLFGLGVLVNFNFVSWVERTGGFFAGALWYGATCLVLMWAVSFLEISSLQRAILFRSQVGQTVMPYLQNAYNQLAERARLATSHQPIGVEAEPRVVMPPDAD
jgi:uncharacterized membrane protein required for colicin V production